MEEKHCIDIHISMLSDGPSLEVIVDEDAIAENPERFIQEAAAMILYFASDVVAEEAQKQIKFYCKSTDSKNLYKEIKETVKAVAMEKLNRKLEPAVSPLDVFSRS